MTADTFKTTVCVHLDAMYRVALALCGNGADAADAPMPTELTADEAHATTQRALNRLCQVMAKGETAIAKSDSTTTHAIEQTMRKLNKLQ